MSEPTRAGFVTIIGRPNVGKSTLINQLIGQKLSITADKPQTTRHSITGIMTVGHVQVVIVDTPGIHQNNRQALNRYMNNAARQALVDVDCVVFVLDRMKFTEEDSNVLNLLKELNTKVICVINKVDLIEKKSDLLPHLQKLQDLYDFEDIIPLTARAGKGCDRLTAKLLKLMPESPHFYEAQDITNRPLRFRIGEIIREKLTRLLGQELPYALTVEIETLEREERLVRVLATIWIERASQRPIILGRGGSHLKDIATKARIDIEQLVDIQVYLKLWVKVRASWSNDERALKSLGYDD